MTTAKFKVGDAVRICRSLADPRDPNRTYGVTATRMREGKIEHKLHGLKHCDGWAVEEVLREPVPE